MAHVFLAHYSVISHKKRSEDTKLLPALFVQSDEKSDRTIRTLELCGIASAFKWADSYKLDSKGQKFRMNSKEHKIIYLQNLDYEKWVRDNRLVLKEIDSSGQIPIEWLNRGSNRKYLIQYYHDMGMTITIG